MSGDMGHVTGDKGPSYVPHMSLIWPSYGPNMALIWPLYGLIWPSYGPHMSLICPSMSLICTSYGPHRTLICPSNDPHMSLTWLTWMSLMSLISLACCSSQPPPPPHSPPTRLLLFSRWRCKKDNQTCIKGHVGDQHIWEVWGNFTNWLVKLVKARYERLLCWCLSQFVAKSRSWTEWMVIWRHVNGEIGESSAGACLNLQKAEVERSEWWFGDETAQMSKFLGDRCEVGPRKLADIGKPSFLKN